MQKIISIIRGKKHDSYDDFYTSIKDLVNKIRQSNPRSLHYTITLEKPPTMSVIPFRKEKIALISVTSEDNTFLDIIRGTDGFSGSFNVTEALPIAYEKDWNDGEATPGVCLLTLFRKKKGLYHDAFIDRWHNGHTPLTLKLHPIYHYNRNTVNDSSGDPPVWYDGIVEEHCRSRKELMNPFIFFGKPWMAPINMIKVYFDVKTFIDYKCIETYLVTEYRVIG